MENNWKGTKGEWQNNNCYVMSGNDVICDSMNETIEHEESKCNARLIADAGNIRQQINCSLPELLERFKAMGEALQEILNEHCFLLHEVETRSPNILTDLEHDWQTVSEAQQLLSAKTIVK